MTQDTTASPADNSNDVTLQAYEANVQKYINGTPPDVDGDVKAWIDSAVSYVKQDGKVLELGSAFGRDATYLEAKGLNVQRTDATKAFVDLLQQQGHTARVLNVITGDFDGVYDMVFANAVLLHFTPTETERVLAKMYQSLASNGIAAFTVKQGEGESWSDAKLDAPRYFCYWKEDDLRSAVEKAGFEIVELTTGSTKNADWLQIIARKPE